MLLLPKLLAPKRGTLPRLTSALKLPILISRSARTEAEEEEKLCRFCFDEGTPDDPLVRATHPP